MKEVLKSIDVGKILTAVLTAVILYMGAAVYEMDKERDLMKYQLNQINYVLQDIYEQMGYVQYVNAPLPMGLEGSSTYMLYRKK